MTTPITNPFVTKDGIEVKINQIWRDLDKRMTGRLVQIRELGVGKFSGRVKVQHYSVHAGASGQFHWISVSRMHHQSTGFELVTSQTSI